MYKYNAEIVRVVDGDTVDAMVDLGFNIFRKIRIRLYGINTPETRTRDLEEKKRGLAAKDRLIEILTTTNNRVVLESHGVGKYGRCIGELWYDDNELSIQQQLILEGHGERYTGGSSLHE